MTYATLCSGIEGFGLGFDRAGMTCVYQCELDKDCRKVLERHYPKVNRGSDVNDSRTAGDLIRLRPDVIGFGSPCQDLSVAGRRGGISAERSGLFFRCVELCFACEASLVVWENVPGVFSSHGGEDFASVLEAFTGVRPEVPPDGWKDTGVCIGPLYSVAWAVLDAQWFGVPQRRRRVFVVGSFGDRGSPYEILSLGESVPWDSPPSREARTRVAASLTAGVASGSGVNRPGRRREDDFNIVNSLDTRQGGADDGDAQAGHLVAGVVPSVCPALKRRDYKGPSSDGDGDGAILVPMVTHSLSAEGADASEDGTGRGTPGNTAGGVPFTIHGTDDCAKVATESETAQCVRAGQRTVDNSSRTVVMSPVSFQTRCTRNGRGMPSDVVPALTSCEGGTHADTKPHVFSGAMAVRRLTPMECERLQGFPDEWTKWDADGKQISDSARYRMIGNAVSVPVAFWVGKRIAMSCR